MKGIFEEAMRESAQKSREARARWEKFKDQLVRFWGVLRATPDEKLPALLELCGVPFTRRNVDLGGTWAEVLTISDGEKDKPYLFPPPSNHVSSLLRQDMVRAFAKKLSGAPQTFHVDVIQTAFLNETLEELGLDVCTPTPEVLPLLGIFPGDDTLFQ